MAKKTSIQNVQSDENTSSSVDVSKVRARKSRALPFMVVLTLLLLVAIGVAGYLYYQLKRSQTVQDNQQGELDRIMQEIGSVMELPQGETPTLATVTDREKLSEQPFFQKAENGDKVIIYSGNGRAILYRPSTKKIVDVTTVNVNTGQPSEETTSVPTPEAVTPETSQEPLSDTDMKQATVSLYNGSTKVGVTNSLEDKIVTAFPKIVVEKKEKAAKNDYTGTTVIDLSGKNADLAKQMADTVGGTVAPTLPEGETNPGTDLLVIVGNE